jgi:1,6-anhydro-N-acetylmuramate kinase
MPFSAQDTAKYREDVRSDGKSLQAAEREQLLKVRRLARDYRHLHKEHVTDLMATAIPPLAAHKPLEGQ